MFASTVYPVARTRLDKILHFIVRRSDSQSAVCLNKDITINAPLEKIYEFVIRPGNLPRIWHGITEIKNEQPLSNGGYCAEWTYKMGGLLFNGAARCTAIVQHEWYTFETTGDIISTISWTFRKKGLQTRVTFSVDYLVPAPVKDRFTEAYIVKSDEYETELILANLKMLFEPRTEES